MGNFQELNKIKKIYGERFMKMCRELFPTLLEQEGALLEVLARTFANNSKVLYEDIIEAADRFYDYVFVDLNKGFRYPELTRILENILCVL